MFVLSDSSRWFIESRFAFSQLSIGFFWFHHSSEETSVSRSSVYSRGAIHCHFPRHAPASERLFSSRRNDWSSATSKHESRISSTYAIAPPVETRTNRTSRKNETAQRAVTKEVTACHDWESLMHMWDEYWFRHELWTHELLKPRSTDSVSKHRRVNVHREMNREKSVCKTKEERANARKLSSCMNFHGMK